MAPGAPVDHARIEWGPRLYPSAAWSRGFPRSAWDRPSGTAPAPLRLWSSRSVKLSVCEALGLSHAERLPASRPDSMPGGTQQQQLSLQHVQVLFRQQDAVSHSHLQALSVIVPPQGTRFYRQAVSALSQRMIDSANNSALDHSFQHSQHPFASRLSGAETPLMHQHCNTHRDTSRFEGCCTHRAYTPARVD